MNATVLFPTEAEINPLEFYRKEITHAPFLIADRKGYAQRIMCPFCRPDELSFVIHAKTGAYRCLRCEKTGASVLDFIMDHKKLSIDLARDYLNEHYGSAPAAASDAPAAPDTGPAPHPLCLWLPDMSAEEFDKLKADIQAQGLRHPILLHEDLILDGRHRARACAELGIVASFEQWTGNDPLAFVLSENLHRRHLTTDQRAAIGARLATRSRGGDRRSEAIKGSNDPLNPAPALTIDDAAKVMNVSPASVKRAKAKAALPAPVSLPPDACRSDDLEVTEADPTGPESAPVKRVSLPGQSGYSGANTRTAARLRRLASELESAMGSEQRTGVPLAEALALLRDIQATARGLAAILEKRLGEVDGAEVRT